MNEITLVLALPHPKSKLGSVKWDIRNGLAIGLIVLVLGDLPVMAQAPAHAYKNMDEAQADVKKYTALLADNPHDAVSYCNRGDAYAFIANWDAASADYTAALQINPNCAPAYYGRGLVKYHNRNFDEAIVDFTAAIKIKPDYGPAYRIRGESNFKNTDAAIADFNMAVKLNPNDDEALFGLGNFYYNRAETSGDKSDYDRAITALTAAIKIKPNDENYCFRGNAFLALGEYDKAIADYTSAHDQASLSNIAIAHFALGEYQKAVADYQNSMMYGGFPDPEGVAQAYYANGQLKEALDNFRSSASNGWGPNSRGGNSYSRRPFFYIWLIEMEQGHQTDEANKELVQGLQSHSEYDDDDCLPQIGDYLLGNLSEDGLLKIYNESAKPSPPQKYEPLFFIAMKRLLGGDTTGAKKFFQICVDQAEKHSLAYQFSKVHLASLANK